MTGATGDDGRSSCQPAATMMVIERDYKAGNTDRAIGVSSKRSKHEPCPSYVGRALNELESKCVCSETSYEHLNE